MSDPPVFLLLLALATASAQAQSRPAPPAEFVAATLNIWHDQESWPARLAVLLDSLRALDPDVLFLQEILEKEGLPNQARTLADSLGWAYVFASVDPPGAPKRYGNAILTRHRIVGTHEAKLAPLDDYRVAAHVRLDVQGRLVDAYVTHLHHTLEGGAIRAAQVQGLLAFIDSTRGDRARPGGPGPAGREGGGGLVVGGDFNAAPDAPELKPLRERFTDTYALTHPEQVGVLVSTLNPAKEHAPRRIDYVFAEPGLLQPVASSIFLDAPTAEGVWGSDHFGVWTRFRWSR